MRRNNADHTTDSGVPGERLHENGKCIRGGRTDRSQVYSLTISFSLVHSGLNDAVLSRTNDGFSSERFPIIPLLSETVWVSTYV